MCAYIIYYISFFVYNEGSSKTHQSSLTLKGGSTSHLGLLPSGKKRKPLLLVALNRFAIWLADHQRSTPAAELRFFLCGDEPALLKSFLWNRRDTMLMALTSNDRRE